VNTVKAEETVYVCLSRLLNYFKEIQSIRCSYRNP